MAVTQPKDYCLMLVDVCLTSAEWAAWVQAVGSVAAIAAASFGVWWQTRERRRDARFSTAETLLARFAILRLVAGQWEAYIQAQQQSDKGTPTILPPHHKALLLALSEGVQVALSDMPTAKCVEHLTQFRAAMQGGIALLEKAGPARLGAHEMERMQAGQRVLMKALDGIWEEAQRLQK